MISLKNKKASHVGIVLSFVIFITFLIFLYSIIEPATRVERGKEKTLELLVPALSSYLSEKITTASIDLSKYSGTGSCVSFPSIAGISDVGVIAKNNLDEIIASEFNGDDTTDVYYEDLEEFDSIKLYYSKGLNLIGDSLDSCDSLTEDTDFNYGLIRTNEYIFESEINDTLEFVADNYDFYEELKGNLSIPLGDEFGFGFKNNDGEVYETEEKEGLTNIYVEELPIQYIDGEANIKSGFLIVEVW